jgi:hypothetical protein
MHFTHWADHRAAADLAHAAFRQAHVEHAFIECHRAGDHRQILVLAVAQHAHLHLLIGLDRAHLRDQRAIGVGTRHGLAVERDDHVAVAQSRLGGRTPRAHAEYAHAFLVAARIHLDSEHRTRRPARDEPHVMACARAELVGQLRDFAHGLVEPRSRFLELRARLGLFGFALRGVCLAQLEVRDLGIPAAAFLDGRRLCERRSARGQQTNQHPLFHEESPAKHQKFALTISA